MMNAKWFKISIADIERKLKTNAASGLSPRAARSRANKGAGQLFILPRKPLWRILLEIFSDFALVILILGAGFSLFFEIEEYLKGLTVFAIAIVALAICGTIYYCSQRMMESVNSYFYPTAKVVRGGRLFAVDYRSVVVGDVVLLEKGDVICADARLVTSDSLRVRMRTSVKEYLNLEKAADADVDQCEIRAKNMANMVHGGSVVLSGSARAIVCAVGKYTYLGAMTGGIALPMPEGRSTLLEKMRKQFSKINMTTLMAIIPFTIVSLLLGKMLSERQSALSVAFLSALAIAATTMPQLICVLLKIHYTHKIRELITGADPAVVKSVESFEKLSQADYIFMLDGAAVTDGVLHCEAAVCAEGEIRSYSSLGKSSKLLSEYVALYYDATTRSLTSGISGASDYILGIREFVNRAGVDIGELRIRCKVSSYLAGNLVDTPERIIFTDRGISYCLNIYKDIKALYDCNRVLLNGTPMSLSEDGKKTFERYWKNAESKGNLPILFTLSTEEKGYSDNAILGIIMLREGIDPEIEKKISSLDRLGCKIISFSNRGRAPKLPRDMLGRGCVVKAAFERNKLPITYNFGSIRAYSDLSDEDIISLIDYAHSQNKRVVVLGFTEASFKIASKADGFITCSDITSATLNRISEELHTAEAVGQRGSSGCSQIVKEKADCIITRPRKNRGGLVSIISVFSEAGSLHCNISDYLRYMISTQIIRFIMVGIPMIFGDAILDARHIMLCAFVLDFFAFFSFMMRKGVYLDRRAKNYCNINSQKEYFIGDNAMLISSVVASAFAIMLPRIVDLLAGGYDYKTEVLFTSLLLLHFISYIAVYYGNNIKDIKNIYKNKLLLIELAVILVVWVASFTVSPFGLLFGVEGWMSGLYLLISLASPVMMSVLFFILNRKRQIINF